MSGTAFADLRRGLAVPEQDFAGVGRGCHIYGAGGFGRRIARELVRLDVPVLGFVDRTGHKRSTVDGLPCRHPDDLGDAEIEESAYVHGLMNHHPYDAVVDWAVERGFAQILFAALLFAIAGFSLDNYWLAPRALMIDHLDMIEALHDGLADDESRALLCKLLDYRLSTDPRDQPDAFASEAYVPRFLPIFEKPITFVDGGAYDGDTLEALLAHGVAVKDWIAFEPDERNMAALRDTARRHRASIGSYTLIEAGLSRENAMVRFAGGDGETSRVIDPASDESAAIGSSEIRVVRLDDALSRSGEVYVKLDIEGAERDALEGMAELLARRPTVAVSVYHRPSDLWDIPQIVANLYDRPRFRLRQHGHHGFDTVLYVTPN
ncbi:FkbM family methyltransferase [Methylobacterium sp. WL116]|uniref:FkbM family methyltransferase n=1 Tax=Methylobacterium sp. WL116 TaxID=2603889 RepID=UPI0011C939F0|nr:FkbM family methyltransferase [Methylobacterium sp. WL116]TXM93746.1 FkbM family methyltransferase [Methylobacterium sp. WL116]